MKKIIIVYHGYMFGHYMIMMCEQFRKLIQSGLYEKCDKFYIGIVDTPDKSPSNGLAWLNAFWNCSSSKGINPLPAKIEIKVYPDNHEETDTLKWIRDYAKENPSDYILYFHTKGITLQNECTEDWRKYMEYFVIENWTNCVQKLNEGFDCCGVLWNSDTNLGYWPHFSGGMWWANTNYINTLQHDYLDKEWRYYREFWIGSNPNVKQFEFHNSRLNDKEPILAGRSHYQIRYLSNNYRK
jgi:hypothetical protein